MKINFLLVTLIIIVSATSCSSSYKNTQTPDDVYYSPARLQTNNVRRDEQKNVDDNSASTTQDNEVRVRVHNRRYRTYDDRYDYPYGYGNNYPYNNNYPVYRNPKYGSTQNQSQPRKTNLGAYKPNTNSSDSTVIFNPKLGNQNTSTTAPVRPFGTPANTSNNNRNGIGNFIRRVFTAENNSSTNTNNSANNNNAAPSRTFDAKTSNNNSSNSSTSSGSSSSGSNLSAPVRTFGKDK